MARKKVEKVETEVKTEPTKIILHTIIIDGVDVNFNKELQERINTMDPKFNVSIGGVAELEVLKKKHKLNVEYTNPLQNALYVLIDCDETDFKIKYNKKENKFEPKDIKVFQDVYEDLGNRNYFTIVASSTELALPKIANFIVEQINALNAKLVSVQEPQKEN